MTDAVRKASPEPRNYDLELEGSSFTLLVNGVRIMCKGGNWVPADPFPCRITKEKYERQQTKDKRLQIGEMYEVEITRAEEFDLYGHLTT